MAGLPCNACNRKRSLIQNTYGIKRSDHAIVLHMSIPIPSDHAIVRNALKMTASDHFICFNLVGKLQAETSYIDVPTVLASTSILLRSSTLPRNNIQPMRNILPSRIYMSRTNNISNMCIMKRSLVFPMINILERGDPLPMSSILPRRSVMPRSTARSLSRCAPNDKR